MHSDDVEFFRQSAVADITLRMPSGEFVQYVKQRSGRDKHAGAETSRVNKGNGLETFGTVMIKKFIIPVDPDKLMCPEIEAAVGFSIEEELKQMLGDRRFLMMSGVVVYSSGRYVVRNEGMVSTEELSKNMLFSKTTLK